MEAELSDLILRRRGLAVKSALAQGLELVTGGEDATAFFACLAAQSSAPEQSVCGAVWRPRSIAYRCLV